MNRGQTMIISPLLKEKIHIRIDKMGSGSSQACFILVDKVGSIVKLLNISLFIPFRTLPLLVDKIVNDLDNTIFDMIIVKEFFYLKALKLISITFDKYKRKVG